MKTGILKRLIDAKTKYEIGEEIETIRISMNALIIEKKVEPNNFPDGIIKGEQLKAEMDKSEPKPKTVTLKDGNNNLIVTFDKNRKNRKYEITQNGEIIDEGSSLGEEVEPVEGEVLSSEYFSIVKDGQKIFFGKEDENITFKDDYENELTSYDIKDGKIKVKEEYVPPHYTGEYVEGHYTGEYVEGYYTGETYDIFDFGGRRSYAVVGKPTEVKEGTLILNPNSENYREGKFDFKLNSDQTYVIPSTVNGYTVTSVRFALVTLYSSFYNANNGFTGIRHLALPNTVKKVDNNAFKDSDIETIKLPESLEEISEYAFSGCSSITNISIPDGVKKIGKNAFENCSQLKSITIPSGITEIKSATFAGCTKLESFIIPDTVTTIGYGAFNGCTSLEEIIIEAQNPLTTAWGSFNGISESTIIKVPNTTMETWLKDTIKISNTVIVDETIVK